MTAVPMQMIKPPMNMPTRRPKRSLEEEAAKLVHVDRGWRDRVVRARTGEERADNTTDVVHGEDDTGSWFLRVNECQLLQAEACTLAKVGTVCKSVDICLHTVDPGPKRTSSRCIRVGRIINSSGKQRNSRFT